MGVRPDDSEKFDMLAEELSNYDAHCQTCHCTGIEQYTRLKCRMGEKLNYIGTGDSVEL